jgi:hypothetical protein
MLCTPLCCVQAAGRRCSGLLGLPGLAVADVAKQLVVGVRLFCEILVIAFCHFQQKIAA